MSIFLRIWAAFAIVLLVGAYVTINALQDQVKPSVKQAIEDTLADNANLISALVADDLKNQRLQTPEFQEKIAQILARPLRARIWERDKNNVSQQLYITDDQGIVLYDSQGQATGQNYSQWNDVYLTLQGRYGVRSTRSNPEDVNSSVMYVAAPIMDKQRIIGVVSLSKAGRAMQPFIERAQQQMLKQGAIVVVLSLFFSALVAWWLRHAIYQVAQYALTLSPLQRKPLHFWAAQELNQLIAAIDQMRQQLEGKEYVENYVHTLTHELKSPLTAIQASAELLQDELPTEDRLRFCDNIEQQTDKLKRLIEHLLLLARLEKQQLLVKTMVDLTVVMQKVLADKAPQFQQKQIQCQLDLPQHLFIEAEPFWLEQALSNLVDNALDFTPIGKNILIHGEKRATSIILMIQNQGQHIPDYALTQLFNRYYSLPRPDTQRKSTGLGLTLVKEVMHLHQATVVITNVEEGVAVRLYFPLFIEKSP